MKRSNHHLPILAVLAGILWFLGAGAAPVAADVASDYYSLHLEPQEIMYKDSAGDYQFETRAGFPYVHDYTDSKVLCGSEFGPCTNTTRTASLRVLKKYIPRFKVYVPPDTSSLQIILYLPKLGQVATVSRFGLPPTGNYSGMRYDEFPIDDDHGATIAELQAADYITRNSGGHTKIIDKKLPTVPAEGGWIYVRVLIFDTSEPIENRYSFEVRLPEYLDWFETMNWSAFEETGGYVQPGRVTDGGYTGDTSGGGGGTYTPPPPPASNTPSTSLSGNPASGSTPENPLGDIFGFLTTKPSGGNTSPEPESTATIFQKLIESGGYGQVTLHEITEYSGDNSATLNMRPKMKLMNAVPGPYNCFAALIGGPVVFLAERDLFGQVVFTRFFGGDRLRSYKSSGHSLAANSVIECDAFSSENLADVDSGFLAQSGIMFLFGVAPEDDLGKFQGIVYTFKDAAE